MTGQDAPETLDDVFHFHDRPFADDLDMARLSLVCAAFFELRAGGKFCQ
jgi:hypothetical protein